MNDASGCSAIACWDVMYHSIHKFCMHVPFISAIHICMACVGMKMCGTWETELLVVHVGEWPS